MLDRPAHAHACARGRKGSKELSAPLGACAWVGVGVGQSSMPDCILGDQDLLLKHQCLMQEPTHNLQEQTNPGPCTRYTVQLA